MCSLSKHQVYIKVGCRKSTFGVSVRIWKKRVKVVTRALRLEFKANQTNDENQASKQNCSTLFGLNFWTHSTWFFFIFFLSQHAFSSYYTNVTLKKQALKHQGAIEMSSENQPHVNTFQLDVGQSTVHRFYVTNLKVGVNDCPWCWICVECISKSQLSQSRLAIFEISLKALFSISVQEFMTLSYEGLAASLLSSDPIML